MKPRSCMGVLCQVCEQQKWRWNSQKSLVQKYYQQNPKSRTALNPLKYHSSEATLTPSSCLFVFKCVTMANYAPHMWEVRMDILPRSLKRRSTGTKSLQRKLIMRSSKIEASFSEVLCHVDEWSESPKKALIHGRRSQTFTSSLANQ